MYEAEFIIRPRLHISWIPMYAKNLEFIFEISLFIKSFISAFTLFDFALEKKFSHVYSNPS